MTTVTVETPVHVEAPAVPVFPELVRAAEIIRERGWYQGDYYEGYAPGHNYGGGPVCAVGALILTHDGGFDSDAPWPPGFFALGDEVGKVPSWNDAPERTQEEVIDLLERVGWLGS